MGASLKQINTGIFTLFVIIISIFSTQVLSDDNQSKNEECQSESPGSCVNKSDALVLKIIGIAAILVTSMIGVCSPLFSRSIPALKPDRPLFIIVKAFASGIILGTGFMHVLPDSFLMLSSSCLPEKPWHKFPFTGFVAMLSAIITLMVDSMATTIYTQKASSGDKQAAVDSQSVGGDTEMAGDMMSTTCAHMHHFHGAPLMPASAASQLPRFRVVAMVLELGIVVHSVVIGLSLGASNNICTIKPLVAALCFHQMFEGMGLGGCILQAEYKLLKKGVMVFFFSVTTPFGIALGIALSNVYKEYSSNSLIIIGLLNASSAGLSIYMALVDLLSADFMGPKLQSSIKLQLKCYVAVLLGAGGMSLMAIWA